MLLKVFSNLNNFMILCGLLEDLAFHFSPCSKLLHVPTAHVIPGCDTALRDATKCVWKGKRAILQHPCVALLAVSCDVSSMVTQNPSPWVVS